MSDTTTEATPSTTTPPQKKARLRLLPVVSLSVGVASMIWTSRAPERAPLIVAIALLGWIATIVTTVLLRRFDVDDSRRGRAVRFVAVWLSQYAVQTSLAFPIPFFARAVWPLLPWHVPFVVAYTLAVVVAFWDPFYERVARRPLGLVALQAFAAFVALLTVLPIVGLDNTRTFIVAGVAVAVGAPLWFWLTGQRQTKRGSFSAASCVALVCAVVVGAPLVPPAPLSLAESHLCKTVQNREPQEIRSRFDVDEAVVCHTVIAAPLGLNDKLVHVWRVDGRELQRVDLDVNGVKGRGFRTWSRLSRAPAGHLTCRVETARGQIVGAISADVVRRVGG